MKVGLDIRHAGLSYDEIVNIARRADELRFDSITLSDKPTRSSQNEIVLESWSLLPSLAMNTKNTKISSSIDDAFTLHPGVLAKMAASIDMMSKGRLIVSVDRFPCLRGESSQTKDSDLESKIGNFEEYLQVMIKLWSESTPTFFNGKHYHLDNAESLPKPIQKPHPPLLFRIKTADRFLKMAARYADIASFSAEGTSYSELFDALERQCEKIGRDHHSIEKTMTAFCNPETGMANAVEQDSDLSPVQLSGTSDRILDQINRYESVGIHKLFLSFPRIGQRDNVMFFGEKVLPELSN